MSVHVGDADAEALAKEYTDGYWTMLRLNEPGSYTPRVTQPPHKKWQGDDAFTMHGSYTTRTSR